MIIVSIIYSDVSNLLGIRFFSLVVLSSVLPKGVSRGYIDIAESNPLNYFIVYSDHPWKLRHTCFKS